MLPIPANRHSRLASYAPTLSRRLFSNLKKFSRIRLNFELVSKWKSPGAELRSFCTKESKLIGRLGRRRGFAILLAKGHIVLGLGFRRHDLLEGVDLVANMDLADSWDTVNNTPGGDPGPGQNHGTAVAGLVGEMANNGIGGSGVAPDATLISYRMAFGAGFLF